MKLSKHFYLRPDVAEIARDLLGKSLFTNTNGVVTGGMIVEAEAYCGATDRASHAYMNKRTCRTKVMFGTGGSAYVYLCYGIHCLFNIVTNNEGHADAVLIRAMEPTHGLDVIRMRRNLDNGYVNLTSGPGKLTKALGIDLKHNGVDLTQDQVWIEENGVAFSSDQIVSTTRIGVEYSGIDAFLPWRYYIKNNKWVSKP
ncbi:MAG: DNA-3-methyladenine glycosylase [Bacteroidetes bacterium]|nr:DNA-3-methyladenine glycosylase [Bacteroidota bacterium]